MRANWKSRFLIVALGTLVAAAPAVAQVGIVIGRNPPPPMRYERRAPMPGQGYVWQDGFWAWRGGRYVWVPGHWVRPPYAGAYWVHPHYDRYGDGYHYHDGYWAHEDHGDHHDWDHDRYRDRTWDNDHDRDNDRH